MYRAIGLLRPDSEFTIDLAQTRLASQLPGFDIAREGEQIVLSKDEWWIAVRLATGPDVQTEIQGLVEQLAGIEPAEAEEYASTGRRVEVWTDVSDPYMEHFDDYQTVVGVLKSFPGLLVVDPKERGIV